MSARDEFPYLASLPDVAGYGEGIKALDEIDRLRAQVEDLTALLDPGAAAVVAAMRKL